MKKNRLKKTSMKLLFLLAILTIVSFNIISCGPSLRHLAEKRRHDDAFKYCDSASGNARKSRYQSLLSYYKELADKEFYHVDIYNKSLQELLPKLYSASGENLIVLQHEADKLNENKECHLEQALDYKEKYEECELILKNM